MYHPRPDVAASISATVSVINDRMNAIIAPENIEGSAPGKRTFFTMSFSESPRVRAELISRWSILWTPYTAPIRMGQKAPIKIKNIDAEAKVGSSTIVYGGYAVGGMGEMAFATGYTALKRRFFHPRYRPIGIAVARASA